MPLAELTAQMLPAIESELQRVVGHVDGTHWKDLRSMLAYHLGWEGPGAGREASGKRIRPLAVLMATAAAGGEWENALPAAAAVELVHNFSLIHDDIEDKSQLRRGRPTVWALWGIAQAINTGDAMFTLAHLAMLDLPSKLSTATILEAIRLLQQACLSLTQGQFLDMTYESKDNLDLEHYWPMISGKTGALLAACTELGSLIAGSTPPVREAYRLFGFSLGLAFQAQDDWLGIWGDAALMGKSADSDLVSGKKSLPILFGLNQKGAFAQRWREKPIAEEEVPEIAGLLAAEGAQEFTRKEVERLTQTALQALETAKPIGEAGTALQELAGALLNRNG